MIHKDKKDEEVSRMDTTGDSTDSRTAPTKEATPTLEQMIGFAQRGSANALRGGVTPGSVAGLVEKFKEMRDTSIREMHKAQARNYGREAMSRKAEACTLNVVLSELEAALSTPVEQKDDDEPHLETLKDA